MATQTYNQFTPGGHPPLLSTAKSYSQKPGDFIHTEFTFEPYVKAALSLKLDNDEQLCPDFLSRGRCPRGFACPRRHLQPSPLNFLPAGSSMLRDPNKRTVCKHWLRGLCKKGDQCDYLHEYDLRRIPECRFFATFGFCNSGDDCLYLHVDKAIKRKECERYNRGFCPKGPSCTKKHVRRVACPFYLCGFCPEGPNCKMGHIKSTPPSAKSRSNSPIQTHRPLTAAEAFGSTTGRPDGGAGGYVPPQRNYAPGDRPQQPRPAGAGGWKKDLSEVLCFKCGEYGHFANACPNPNRPGNRGGQERGPGGGGGGGRPMGNGPPTGRPRPY